MFFTQDDYKKIQAWLTKNSIKDTEFNEAIEPLNGNETITLVQNGHNVKASLKDFISQLFLLGVSDFLNVSERFNEKYISLSQAIALIPFRSRKIGQVITFLDESGEWKIYQFQGERVNQWNNINLWDNLLDFDKYIINSILPDEEDLTKTSPDENGNSYLKLKDKTYNPDEFSGLGRVYLRKNIVDYEDNLGNVTKKNILVQGMIDKENTIYIIQYDYDLNGQEIEIPENCVLQFEGGSFSNGILIGNNTNINAAQKEIFKSIVLKGNYIIQEFLLDWYGTKPNKDNIDNGDIINCAFENTRESNITDFYLGIGIYYTHNSIRIPSNCALHGANKFGTSFYGTPKTQIVNNNVDTPIIILIGNPITLDNLILRKKEVINSSFTEQDCGIFSSVGFFRNVLQNIQISDCYHGILLESTIDNTAYGYNKFTDLQCFTNIFGLTVRGKGWCNLNNFLSCGFTENYIGGVNIKVDDTIQSCTFTSCNFENNGKNKIGDKYINELFPEIEMGGYSLKLSGIGGCNTIEGCYFEGSWSRYLKDIESINDETAINNDGEFILRTVGVKLVGNCISCRGRNLFNIIHNSRIYSLGNDYTNSSGAESIFNIINLTQIGGYYMNIFIKEDFSPTSIKKIFNLVGDNNILSMFTDIDILMPDRKRINFKSSSDSIDEANTIYLSDNPHSIVTNGLTIDYPIRNIDILNYLTLPKTLKLVIVDTFTWNGSLRNLPNNTIITKYNNNSKLIIKNPNFIEVLSNNISIYIDVNISIEGNPSPLIKKSCDSCNITIKNNIIDTNLQDDIIFCFCSGNDKIEIDNTLNKINDTSGSIVINRWANDNVFIKTSKSSSSTYKESIQDIGNSAELNVNVKNNPYKENKVLYYGFDSSASVLSLFVNGGYVDSHGRTVAIKYGIFRPNNLKETDKGFRFFDDNLGAEIVWDGQRWVYSNGDVATNIKGDSYSRPINVNEGFEYYDTDLKKKILWNGTSWVNLDGTPLE